MNTESELVKKYMTLYETNPESTQITTFVSYMYNQALLLEGSEIENMSEFLKMANTLINTSTNS
jgi:HSP90 family molecular chaperone